MEELKSNPVMDQQRTVLIVRTFEMPLFQLWAAWIQAALLKQWWGPKGYTCPHYEIDLTISGKYLSAMKGPDGKVTWGTGEFQQIKPERLLVYTDSFSDESGNIIDASEVGMPGK